MFLSKECKTGMCKDYCTLLSISSSKNFVLTCAIESNFVTNNIYSLKRLEYLKKTFMLICHVFIMLFLIFIMITLTSVALYFVNLISKANRKERYIIFLLYIMDEVFCHAFCQQTC